MNRITSAESLNKKIRGFVFLSAIELTVQADTGKCHLQMTLMKDPTHPSESVEIELEGVSRLSIRDWGGGLIQLPFIQIEDISDQQLDRSHYRVTEMEYEDFSCLCHKIWIC